MEKRVHIFVGKYGSQIEGLCGASSATRRATLHIVALPVLYCSACCGNRRRKTPEAQPGDKSWSSLQQMVNQAPSVAFKLLGGSPKAKVAPVGCAVGPHISGQLTVEGIPVLGLVDTGASVTCMGFAIWWRYRAQWGALKQFEGTVHTASHCKLPGKPSTWIFSGVKLEEGPALLLLWAWSRRPASLVWTLCDRYGYILTSLMAQPHQLNLTRKRCI